MRHLRIYIANGLPPIPQVIIKFNPQEKDPINGNYYIASDFGPNALRSHQEFKAFLACVYPAEITPPQKTHPNWKVQKLFRWAIIALKQYIYLGQRLYVDEQIIGCQGRHPDILLINYKAEGDGFQCDSVCADGYTYSLYFRNQPAPKLLLDLVMSLLHSIVHSLWDQIPSKNYTCAIDNLYMSRKFCRSAWRSKQHLMKYGVARSDNLGVPRCIEKSAVTKKFELDKVRGTLKVAHLKETIR